MTFSRDYIVRMIEQLKKAIDRIRKHTDEQQYDDALDEVGDTCDDLLGHQAHMLNTLDCPSVIRILDKWPRIKVYVGLLQAEADVRAARRSPEDLPEVERLRQRALQLLLLGRAQGGRGDPDLKDAVRTLLPQVDSTALAATYRAHLKDLGLAG